MLGSFLSSCKIIILCLNREKHRQYIFHQRLITHNLISTTGTCGIYNGFAGGDCRRSNPSTGAVPRFKRRGPNIFPRKGAHKPVMTPQSATGWGSGGWLSSWEQTSGRENSSFSKESAILNSISPDPDKQCAICLGVIMNEKKLRCGHRFCRNCVDTALKVHSYCPFCKQPHY